MGSLAHLATIQQRHDLLETGLYLCSAHVLHMFTDNFDYETLADLARGLLAEEEVAAFTCYVAPLHKRHGAHFSAVRNLNTYYLEMMRLTHSLALCLDEGERALYQPLPESTHVYRHSQVLFTPLLTFVTFFFTVWHTG